jgi:hypothetical protein
VAKTWVLDTETKGTGAHIAPLPRAREEPVSERELALVLFKRPPPPRRSDEPALPLRFKVVDVMSAQVLAEGIGARATVVSAQVLAEGIGARATVDLLEGMRSVTDVRIFLWLEATGRWRLLTLAEQKALWGFRRRLPTAAAQPQPAG